MNQNTLGGLDLYVIKEAGLDFYKTWRICCGLQTKATEEKIYESRFDVNNENFTTIHFIMRPILKQLIADRLQIGDPHTLNTRIDKLIGSEIISMNPHTSYQTRKDGTEVYSPSSTTRYFLNQNNIDKIFVKFHILNQEYLKLPTHTPTIQSNLSSYNQSNASECQIINDIRENLSYRL